MKKYLNRQRTFFIGFKKKIFTFINKRPFASFFITLGILFILIIISNVLGAPKKTEKKEAPEIKQVRVFNVGSAPKITVQAQIEKSGIIHLTSLAPGIVWSINKQVGQHISKGETLFSLSSNYQGGNASVLQRQLAQTQYQNVLDTYDLQKDIIKKQRDLADKTDQNADQLRDITNKSLDEMKSLISLNDGILTSLDQNITNLEASNVGGVNDELILATKELKSQFLGINNQAKQGLRMSEFSAAGDKPPADLSNIQKDLTMKQLDLQEKILDLNREISRIQLQIARVVEAMMFPAAPFSGTIQRIFVKVGQQVNPGTELAVLTQDQGNDPVIALAYVSQDIAKRVSRLEPSILHLDGATISSYPTFISEDAIQGFLYGIYFDVPDQYMTGVIEKGFIQVDLPIGYFDTASVIPYIPIDAVYQTKDKSFVYVIKDGKAEAKQLILGNVYGSYVEVEKGLGDKDRIILNRNVIAGDLVTIQ
jgi:multidrug efflux pump subunit AcrA (membrane-fusion protein)